MATRVKNKKLSSRSRAWMQEHLDDAFVKRAQADGYRSRAAYKLLEINDKYHYIKSGMRVVDLGSAPGSWSQIAAQLVGDSGVVVASDILEMSHLSNVNFIQGDFREADVFAQIMAAVGNEPVDVVLSDMAPNMSGNKAVDQPRAMYLCELAADFAIQTLTDNGVLIMKVFQGEGSQILRQTLQQQFSKLKSYKPEASRSRSTEMYWIAQK